MSQPIFSHSIRGLKGKDATLEDMAQNNQRAAQYGMKLVNDLRKMEVYLDLYVPAVHDEFVTIAYMEKMLTEDQILEIDCKIIDRRDLLLVYNWQGGLSSGMKIEVDYAFNNKIPSVEVTGKNYLHDFSQVLDLISEVMGKEEDKTSSLIV